MTWQEDLPSVRLSTLGDRAAHPLSFEGGKDLSLAVLDAPSIWHREALKPDYLERDIAIGWKPPFPALWLTQLYEDEVKTTFEFRTAGRRTRGAAASGPTPTPPGSPAARTMLSLGQEHPAAGRVRHLLPRAHPTTRRPSV